MAVYPLVRHARPDRQRRRGQALVELALLLPVFLFLTMGVLQVAALAMVWINLQGLTQDTARWMAVSSQGPSYNADCTTNTTTHVYPRPRWADGDDGLNYVRCSGAPPVAGAFRLLQPANFSTPVWTPTCANGVDCAAATGGRRADGALTVSITYNWSNVVFMPGGLQGWLGWFVPATVTTTAAEVMQY
jgi:hypothetical protein